MSKQARGRGEKKKKSSECVSTFRGMRVGLEAHLQVQINDRLQNIDVGLRFFKVGPISVTFDS